MRAVNLSLLIFFSALFYFLNTLATDQLLPALKTEEDKRAFIGQIRQRIPFAGNNRIDFLNDQIQGIEAIKKKFPNYLKMMSEKPGPFSITIFENEETKVQTFALDESRFKLLQSRVEQFYKTESEKFTPSKEKQVQPEIKIKTLKSHAVQVLQSTLEKSGESIRGILIGLSQLLPNEDKAKFFKLGDPQLQLEFLVRKNISDEALKKSKFRPDSVGFTSENISMAHVFSLATRRLEASKEAFVTLSYILALERLAALSKSEQIEILRLQKGIASLLQPTDFDFLYKASSSFLNLVIKEVSEIERRSEASVRKRLENLLSNISRLSFTSQAQTVKSQKQIGRIYEVPPYLGVHRGCAGGDCSTSNSPMFPYSPREHVFYIENASGQFVGYMTVTRVLADKTESLYVKDLAGANLSPELGEAILHVLNKSASNYGAIQIFLAPSTFTDAQNRNFPLRQMLGQYNQQPLTELKLPDSSIRTYIGSQRKIFKSTPHYDAVSIHSRGSLFHPNPKIENKISHQIEKKPIPAIDQKSIGLEVLRVVREFIHKPDVDVESLTSFLSHQELSHALMLFKNTKHHNLTKYYAEIRKYLKTLEFDMTQDFIEKNEILFYCGHLSAPDAFNNKNGKFTEMSGKYFSKLVQMRNRPMLSLEIFREEGPAIEESPHFQETIAILAKSMQPEDVLILAGFADLGSEKAKKVLRKQSNQPSIEKAVADLIARGPTAFGYPSGQIGGLDFSLIEKAINNFGNRPFQNYEETLNQVFSLFQIDWKSIQNINLRTRIQTGFLKSSDIFSSEHRAKAFEMFKSSRIYLQLSSADFLDIIYKMRPDSRRQVDEVINQRLKYLIDQKTEQSMLEIHALHAMGFKQATEALQLAELKNINLEVVRKSFSQQLYVDLDANSILLRMTKYDSNKSVSLLNIRRVLLEKFRSTSEGISRIRESFDYLGVPLDLLIESREIFRFAPTAWLTLPDLFNANDRAALRFTLGFFLYLFQSHAQLVNWESMMTNVKILKQQNVFDSFTNSLRQMATADACAACAEALLYMSALGHLEEPFFSDREFLASLIKNPSITVRAFGVQQAIDNNFIDLLSDQIYDDLVSGLERSKSTLRFPVYNELMKSLLRSLEKLTKLNSTQINMLLKIVNSEKRRLGIKNFNECSRLFQLN